MLITSASAKESVVYPGVYKANVKSVSSAVKVTLSIDVWSGYQRQFIIEIPKIVVPELNEKSQECEKRIVKDGLKFTKDFIKNAKEIEVYDIKMTDSSSNKGKAEIYADKRLLSEALLKKGLVRSIKIDKNKAWCSDE
jgi:hypothetical protein